MFFEQKIQTHTHTKIGNTFLMNFYLTVNMSMMIIMTVNNSSILILI